MLKKIALALVVLIVAILGFAVTKPDTFRVERSTTMGAPPEKIYPLLEDFHRWSAWSPYEKLDPTMQRTYSGAQSGVGAMYAWEGNAKAGAGHMEITEATPPSKILIKLDFTKPFASHNIAEYTLEPLGDSTKVTWAMYGPNLYVGKVMSVFVDMDRMIGKEFETGLANLKHVAEQ